MEAIKLSTKEEYMEKMKAIKDKVFGKFIIARFARMELKKEELFN